MSNCKNLSRLGEIVQEWVNDDKQLGTMPSMNVLQLISSGGYYGAEAMVVNLSKGLRALGASSTIGVFHNLRSPNIEIADAARQADLNVELIPCRGRADRGTVRQIAELAQRMQADLIHAHGYKAQAYGYLASRSRPIPLVATCHGYHSRFSGGVRSTIADLRQRMYSMVDLAFLRRFDQVVATSDILAKSLLSFGIEGEKLSVVGNGVELDGYSSAMPSADIVQRKSGGLAFGMVARLTDGKGHAHLFAAARTVLGESPNALFFVIGEGPLRGSLEALAYEFGIEHSVVFCGKRSDMRSVYAALDVVVLPSLFEGMPMVILEALAARKPVIATRVGAVPDVIRNGSTGLLIEPGNVTELEEAIRRLIVDAELRDSLAGSGCLHVQEHFSAISMAKRYHQLYESVVYS